MDRVILLPGQAAVESYRKRAAQSGESTSFGVTVTTPASWLAQMWEVWGDGRVVASRQQRELAFIGALSSTDGLPASSGMAAIMMRLADVCLGTSRFDAALKDPSLLDDSFAPLISSVRSYERLLRRSELVDPGRAWSMLPKGEAVRGSVEVKLLDVDPSPAMREFLGAHEGVVLDEKPPALISAAEAEVGFAFPSGGYAQPLLVADLIRKFAANGCADGGIVVTSRDPRLLYGRIAPVLASEGLDCAFEGSVPFARTDFGRAVHCVHSIVTSDSCEIRSCTDFLLNPFSGVSSENAYRFDAWARGNRVLERGECLSRMRSLGDAFGYFEELVSSPDACIVIGFFEDRVRGMRDASEAYVAEQLSSMAVYRSVAESACRLDVGMDACFAVLEGASVPASRATSEKRPVVRVMGQRQASMLGRGSCDALVMCDMTSDAYPLRERSDIATALSRAIGLEGASSTLADERRAFSGAASAPARYLVIERCLNDENAEPTYPAAVVEEFVDCYRDDPANADEVDNRYMLPERFLSTIVQRGEESLCENAAMRHLRPSGRVPIVSSSLSHVGPESLDRLVLPRILPGGAAMETPCFSASQIESYLECPQKWFALRRLRLDELDEGFGPAEMGDFSHHVLESFYRRFQKETASKVTKETLPRARDIMREEIETWAAEQAGRPASDTRLVPATELERRQADELYGHLVEYLDREVSMLPGFRPAYMEYSIPASKAVDYAGYKLVGSIDRIDVDDEGRAVVIDYKSTLSSDYDLYDSAGEECAGKVQALIYAQAVRRLLGLEVVGAIYVSYGKTRGISGAIDMTVEPRHLPGMKAKRCQYRSGGLSDLIDGTERRVAEALGRLLSGDIAPSPAHKGVCAWCPEISCPQRQG